MFGSMSHTKTTVLIICTAMLWLMFSSCSGTEVGNPDIPGPGPATDFGTFDSNAELETYLKDQYARSALPLREIDEVGAP